MINDIKKAFDKGFVPVWNKIRAFHLGVQVPLLPLLVLVALGLSPIVIVTIGIKKHYGF